MFDAIIGVYAPAYHKLDRDEGVNCSDKHKCNDIKNWCWAIAIQIFTVAVYFCIGYILRLDIFVFKIDVTELNDSNEILSLRNVTSRNEIFPMGWLLLIGVYVGCLFIYNCLVLLYYKFLHP